MALTEEFDTARSSFVLNATQVALAQKEPELPSPPMEEGSSTSNAGEPLFIPDDDDVGGTEEVEQIVTGEPNEVASTDDSAGIPIEQESDASPPPRPPVEKRPRSASPDPISDSSSTRPLKKKAITTARSSPSPVPEPASTSSSQQRLAGPGRTPARVEQILSTNTSGGTGRGVQMVLDTSGASWNLKPGHEGPPQRKRSHLADADVNISGSSSGKNARVNMRARLAGFARDGAHVVRDDSPEEEEGVEDEVVESSKKVVDEDDEDDDDDDECEVVDKPSSSTDVVDETMAVDHPDSEDEAPKSKPKPKTRAPTSKRTNNADHGPSEELHDSSVPSNTAAATASSSSSRDGVQTEVVRTVVGAAPPLAFDLERTTNTWAAYLERSSAPTSTSTPHPAPRSSELGHADLAADNDNATATLARVLSKADFGSMRVVGQFNRGFIVARLRKTDMANDDLFIVDQHAADEKYNFETLQTTTRLESQRLFTCVRFLRSSADVVDDVMTQPSRAGADGCG